MQDPTCSSCGRRISRTGRGRRSEFCGECPCRYEGCGKPGSHRGHCKYHYEVVRRSESARRCECGNPVLARGLCTRCYPRAHPPTRHGQHIATCLHCGTSKARTRDRGERFCSWQCAQSYRAVRRNGASPNSHGRWSASRCVICSSEFQTGVWNCTTCSPKCQQSLKRMADARRRALQAGAFVEDVVRESVFAADGYLCHLCGAKVDLAKTAPHPSSPTVDHIVPLSKGGSHERANCRTAHFGCNARKQDRGGGEQFALVFD